MSLIPRPLDPTVGRQGPLDGCPTWWTTPCMLGLRLRGRDRTCMVAEECPLQHPKGGDVYTRYIMLIIVKLIGFFFLESLYHDLFFFLNTN